MTEMHTLRPPELQDKPVVLIVDDIPDNLTLLHTTLEQAGYTVLVATDGYSALERASHFLPDAILLDAVMPHMDGFVTCQHIKQNPVTQHIPVIFMTGLTETEHVVLGFQSGGVDYVTKPLQYDEVLARLSTHIKNSRLINQREQMIHAAGIAMLAFDSAARLIWKTPLATQRIEENTEQPAHFYHKVSEWIMQAEPQQTLLVNGIKHNLTLSRFANASHGNHLVMIQTQDIVPNADTLMQSCGLTRREAEVLYWVALGKTNRDIGEILELSPRTVNKHLEHIFCKLNVETRTGAVTTALTRSKGSAPA